MRKQVDDEKLKLEAGKKAITDQEAKISALQQTVQAATKDVEAKRLVVQKDESARLQKSAQLQALTQNMTQALQRVIPVSANRKTLLLLQVSQDNLDKLRVQFHLECKKTLSQLMDQNAKQFIVYNDVQLEERKFVLNQVQTLLNAAPPENKPIINKLLAAENALYTQASLEHDRITSEAIRADEHRKQLEYLQKRVVEREEAERKAKELDDTAILAWRPINEKWVAIQTQIATQLQILETKKQDLAPLKKQQEKYKQTQKDYPGFSAPEDRIQRLKKHIEAKEKEQSELASKLRIVEKQRDDLEQSYRTVTKEKDVRDAQLYEAPKYTKKAQAQVQIENALFAFNFPSNGTLVQFSQLILERGDALTADELQFESQRQNWLQKLRESKSKLTASLVNTNMHMVSLIFPEDDLSDYVDKWIELLQNEYAGKKVIETKLAHFKQNQEDKNIEAQFANEVPNGNAFPELLVRAYRTLQTNSDPIRLLSFQIGRELLQDIVKEQTQWKAKTKVIEDMAKSVDKGRVFARTITMLNDFLSTTISARTINENWENKTEFSAQPMKNYIQTQLDKVKLLHDTNIPYDVRFVEAYDWIQQRCTRKAISTQDIFLATKDRYFIMEEEKLQLPEEQRLRFLAQKYFGMQDQAKLSSETISTLDQLSDLLSRWKKEQCPFESQGIPGGIQYIIERRMDPTDILVAWPFDSHMTILSQKQNLEAHDWKNQLKAAPSTSLHGVLHTVARMVVQNSTSTEKDVITEQTADEDQERFSKTKAMIQDPAYKRQLIFAGQTPDEMFELQRKLNVWQDNITSSNKDIQKLIRVEEEKETVEDSVKNWNDMKLASDSLALVKTFMILSHRNWYLEQTDQKPDDISEGSISQERVRQVVYRALSANRALYQNNDTFREYLDPFLSDSRADLRGHFTALSREITRADTLLQQKGLSGFTSLVLTDDTVREPLRVAVLRTGGNQLSDELLLWNAFQIFLADRELYTVNVSQIVNQRADEFKIREHMRTKVANQWNVDMRTVNAFITAPVSLTMQDFKEVYNSADAKATEEQFIRARTLLEQTRLPYRTEFLSSVLTLVDTIPTPNALAVILQSTRHFFHIQANELKNNGNTPENNIARLTNGKADLERILRMWFIEKTNIPTFLQIMTKRDETTLLAASVFPEVLYYEWPFYPNYVVPVFKGG